MYIYASIYRVFYAAYIFIFVKTIKFILNNKQVYLTIGCYVIRYTRITRFIKIKSRNYTSAVSSRVTIDLTR